MVKVYVCPQLLVNQWPPDGICTKRSSVRLVVIGSGDVIAFSFFFLRSILFLWYLLTLVMGWSFLSSGLDTKEELQCHCRWSLHAYHSKVRHKGILCLVEQHGRVIENYSLHWDFFTLHWSFFIFMCLYSTLRCLYTLLYRTEKNLRLKELQSFFAFHSATSQHLVKGTQKVTVYSSLNTFGNLSAEGKRNKNKEPKMEKRSTIKGGRQDVEEDF